MFKEKKSVSFNLQKNEIILLYDTNDLEMQESRNGKLWIFMALDNQRFKNRIKSLDNILNPILSSSHRTKIYKERFCH